MFNLLDSTYRPVGHPELPPLPPASPERVKAFIYACAVVAEDDAVERVKAMAGVGATRRAAGG